MEQNKELVLNTPVYVLWEDSAAEHGWAYSKPTLTYGRIQSAGLLIDNTSKQILLTLALNDENSRHCGLAIPWSSIKKVVQLNENQQ